MGVWQNLFEKPYDNPQNKDCCCLDGVLHATF